MPQITGTLTNSGDSAALITAGTNGTIQIYTYNLYIVGSEIVVTAKMGSTAKFTCAGVAGDVVVAIQPATNTKEPLMQGAKGENFLINLSAGGTVYYNITYAII